MEGEFDSLDPLADLIFTNDTKLPKSIQLIDSFETPIDIFEALLMLFTKGMRRMYAIGGVVLLDKLSVDEFYNFQQKFLALGVKPFFNKFHHYQILKYKQEPIPDDIINDYNIQKDVYIELTDKIKPEYLIEYQKITSNQLSDYHFQFIADKIYYIINFILI